MNPELAATALLMGLAGGPHCLAMCGSTCLALGQVKTVRGLPSQWKFHFGRVVGYASLGAVAAASMQSLGWLGAQSATLRPIWSMMHIAAAMLGIALLLYGRQPLWLETFAKRIWSKVRLHLSRFPKSGPLLLGITWALLPCGLLYSAALVAALTGNALEGAFVMALFALGTTITLSLTPAIWKSAMRRYSGATAIRLSGLALFVLSSTGLWMALRHNAAPWC
jgi:uncharacterized protein